MNDDGFVYYRDWVCVPNDDELKKSILEKAHSGSFVMHLYSTKMYQDLKTSYCWSGMKRGVTEFVTKCIVLHFVTTYQDTRMEMGSNHNGFCGRVTSDRKKA